VSVNLDRTPSCSLPSRARTLCSTVLGFLYFARNTVIGRAERQMTRDARGERIDRIGVAVLGWKAQGSSPPCWWAQKLETKPCGCTFPSLPRRPRESLESRETTTTTGSEVASSPPDGRTTQKGRKNVLPPPLLPLSGISPGGSRRRLDPRGQRRAFSDNLCEFVPRRKGNAHRHFTRWVLLYTTTVSL
jgi:hypothetical protein